MLHGSKKKLKENYKVFGAEWKLKHNTYKFVRCDRAVVRGKFYNTKHLYQKKHKGNKSVTTASPLQNYKKNSKLNPK